ncbi:LysR family transcriptional regulator [Veronia pacifica]|uniref:HTH lysR-type domain-containing protein n=1 Tax=Veronia pacifica TaxID=1080227 RepID=A0A1C3EAA2_9GAMM|nr:LysR substrate-binding domain-containing protein [Veronia pacifica]ODA30144.1 hypothetical protein A8L45_21115 [Veronia pacifica]
MKTIINIIYMNVSQLRYIVSVDVERNFARAAKLCNVAQPTLSKEIQRLESRLDVIIFDRTCSPVVPTVKGEKLIAQARHILQEMSRFNLLAQSEQASLKGECNLAVCPSIAPYLLPLFLPDFCSLHPDLRVHVYEMSVEDTKKALINETVDAALCCKMHGGEGFYQFDIGVEPFLAYVSDQHALYPQSKIDLSCVAEHELHIAADVTEQLGALSEKEHNLVVESGSLETLRRFVELGHGMTIIPKLATLFMGERRRRFLRAIADPVPHRQLVLAARRGFYKRELLSHLKQSMRKAFDDNISVSFDANTA